MRIISAVLVCVLFNWVATSFAQHEGTAEERAVRKIIEEYYLEVIYGDKDIREIEKGFHPGFNMYVYYNDEFSKRTLPEWMDRLEVNRAKNSSAQKPEYKTEFVFVDVAGQTAVVKLKVFADGKLKYTDYLTLYKFVDGWKVITKQFTFH